MKNNNFTLDDFFEDEENQKKLKVYINGYGEKRDSRVNVGLEKTIRKKAVLKCELLGISLSEAINQLLYIWSKEISEDEIEKDV